MKLVLTKDVELYPGCTKKAGQVLEFTRAKAKILLDKNLAKRYFSEPMPVPKEKKKEVLFDSVNTDTEKEEEEKLHKD